MAFLGSIGKYILSFLLEKVWRYALDYVRALNARRELAKRDEEALKKHDEVIKKPDATDAETGESFENTLNGR